MARRQAHNRLRRASITTVELDDAVDVAQSGPDVEDRAIAAMEFDDIVAGARGLPEHLREVLDLVLVERLSYADIGRILGIPAGTVKSRMSHVKKWLTEGVHRADRSTGGSSVAEGRRR